MYSLHEYLQSVARLPAWQLNSMDFFCTETNLELTMLTNKMHEALAAYTYTLVLQGWLTIIYNGKELTLTTGDLYIYSPGFQVAILKGSEDYRGICLMANENITLESPAIWNIVRTAYYPVSELGQPVVRLNAEQVRQLGRRMTEFIAYLRTDHHFLQEALKALYTLFVLDVRNMMEQQMGAEANSERTADIFVRFIRLLPRHFIQHHDISYYAAQLHITTTHLSRIVKQTTGRTVADHIRQMLLMEATWLLQSTDLSMTDIADRLSFADQSSFGRFFTRLKGISPKAYRNKQQGMNIKKTD